MNHLSFIQSKYFTYLWYPFSPNFKWMLNSSGHCLRSGTSVDSFFAVWLRSLKIQAVVFYAVQCCRTRTFQVTVLPHSLGWSGWALTLVAMRQTISVDPYSQGIVPCVGSWLDLACIGEEFAGNSYCYLLPKGKRDQTKTGVLKVLDVRTGLIVTFISS
jgi:hypothetical protein